LQEEVYMPTLTKRIDALEERLKAVAGSKRSDCEKALLELTDIVRNVVLKLDAKERG
jgi:hypothetical protein